MCGQNKIVFARLNGQVADRHCRKVVAFELRPIFPAIDRHKKTEFCAKKKEIWLSDIFLDHVRVTANALWFLRGNKRSPRFAVISRPKNVRRHVSEGVTVESCVG